MESTAVIKKNKFQVKRILMGLLEYLIHLQKLP
ncbi:hypothetical protein TSAR_006642 [Trichomalopsis sarcophagae]|uniref:Uncharacterized protein n=1 Tax=Trichomalopsis sarcophagae TaxID=543379 RepID=A0A232EY24_9HYME|nr:hypothetical protein TSAR_006642 [Trichomalopsis sarcophagae]